MLTPTELVAMRTCATAALPDSATVWREDVAEGAAGGALPGTPYQVGNAVACRVAPAGGSPQARLLAEQVVGVQAWAITLPAGTDVRRSDQVRVGSRTFVVVGVLAPGSFETARRVVASEVLP